MRHMKILDSIPILLVTLLGCSGSVVGDDGNAGSGGAGGSGGAAGTGGTGAPGRLQVAAAWLGVVAPAEGLTVTHHEGVVEAANQLGYVDYQYQDGLLGDPAADYVDGAILVDGASVIVGNSVDYWSLMVTKAEQYPDVTFLVSGGKSVGPNLGSFYAHIDQAWFIAGRMAARKTRTNHLGIIGSFISPDVVRNINAFTLGARHEAALQDKQVFVEVRWLGFWFDPDFSTPQFEYSPLHLGLNAKQVMSGEEYLTAKLIDSGADVIAHQLENQFPVRYVARMVEQGILPDVFSIAANNRLGWQDQNGQTFANTIGSVYWNWGPIYKELFAEVHDGTWSPRDVMKPMTKEDDSPVGFAMSDAETELTRIQRDLYLHEAVEAGPAGLWTGPIGTTGQRPGGNVQSGEVIDEAEWNSMCWFAEGVVERENPNDPLSQLVPARVPDDVYVGKQGDRLEPAAGEVRQPAAAPEVLISLGVGDPLWNCKLNSPGGV